MLKSRNIKMGTVTTEKKAEAAAQNESAAASGNIS